MNHNHVPCSECNNCQFCGSHTACVQLKASRISVGLGERPMSMDIQNLSSEVNVALLNESSRLRARCERLEKGLKDIQNFHDKEFEELEKEWGYLGWTCCGQKRNLAKAALAAVYSKPSTVNDGTEDK